MTDIVTREVRSRMMSGIGTRDTDPELLVRRYLHAAGLRYRVQGRGLPGTPDLVLRKYRAVVFVHGCFWHRHKGCRLATTPSTRPEFWVSKLEANVKRDERQALALALAGWRVFTVFECQVKDVHTLESLYFGIVSGSTMSAAEPA